MYNIISIIFKYIFIVIIYIFIFSIIRLIYLDIKSMDVELDGKVYLKLVDKKEALKYKLKNYYIIDNIITLGRQEDNHIQIDDQYISKKHFKLVKENDNYMLIDLNSSNGTYVNEEKVEATVKLRDKDLIQVGNIKFLFVNRG